MFIGKSKIFTLCSLAFTLGLGFGLQIDQQFLLYLFGGIFVLASLFWSNLYLRILLLAYLVFWGGAWLAYHKQPLDLSEYNKGRHDLEIEIIDDPVFTEKSSRFTSVIHKLDGNGFNAKLLVTLPRYPEYKYGDVLEVNGVLVEISEFNLKSNASAEMVFPKINNVTSGGGGWFKWSLYNLKRIMIQATNNILSEPYSALSSGLLLGTKNFSPELAEQFRITGTAHIVAISGFNVTIVAGIIDGILRRFGRSAAFYGSLVGILSLVIITGAQASVVRAGFMGGLVLLAQKTGRVYASLNALFITSSIMLFQNPKLLVFDIGFQLSFAALAGLMFVQPQLDELVWDFPLKSFLFPTIAAQITTTPLLLYHFGNFSFISVVTNLFVLPVIPWAMLVGFVAVIVAIVIPPLGIYVGGLAWIVLAYVIKIIDFSSKLPGAAVSDIPFPMWLVILYYLVLVFYLKWKPKLLESSNLS